MEFVLPTVVVIESDRSLDLRARLNELVSLTIPLGLAAGYRALGATELRDHDRIVQTNAPP